MMPYVRRLIVQNGDVLWRVVVLHMIDVVYDFDLRKKAANL